jgi:hypothetical protein
VRVPNTAAPGQCWSAETQCSGSPRTSASARRGRKRQRHMQPHTRRVASSPTQVEYREHKYAGRKRGAPVEEGGLRRTREEMEQLDRRCEEARDTAPLRATGLGDNPSSEQEDRQRTGEPTNSTCCGAWQQAARSSFMCRQPRPQRGTQLQQRGTTSPQTGRALHGVSRMRRRRRRRHTHDGRMGKSNYTTGSRRAASRAHICERAPGSRTC